MKIVMQTFSVGLEVHTIAAISTEQTIISNNLFSFLNLLVTFDVLEHLK